MMTWEDFFEDPISALDQAIPDYFAFDFNDDSIPDIEFRCMGGSPIPTQFAFNVDGDRAAEAVVNISIGDDGSVVTSFKADISGDNKFDFGLTDHNGDWWPDLVAVDVNQDGIVNNVLPTSTLGLAETTLGFESGLQGWVAVDEQMTSLPDEPNQFGPLAYGEFESASSGYANTAAAPSATYDEFQSQWQSDWHQQQSDTSCAVCCQEFILDEALGREVSEKELIEVATKLGIYSPLGTAPSDVGLLLQFYGVPSEMQFHSDLNDMINYVRNGHGVIALVDADEIWGSQELTDCRGVPLSGANHAVQVLGLETNNGQVSVLLNDPGHPQGCGLRVPVDTFMDAWHDSEKAMCITKSPVLA